MAETTVPPLKIALISEKQYDYRQLGYSEEECAALPHNGEVEAVSATLQKLGHHVTLVPGVQALVQELAAGNYKEWHLAFNMAQDFHGSARETQVPSLLEAYQIPFTFSNAATMAMCQNKSSTKMILDHYQLPNAPFMVIPAKELGADPVRSMKPLQSYPLFVKPISEGSSKGVEKFNKVIGPEDLEPAVQKLKATFPDQDILVESFLAGREVSVSILGTGSSSRVIGTREDIWRTGPSDNGKPDFSNRISKSKASTEDKYILYIDSEDKDDPQIKAACSVALNTWNVLGCRDAGRVDMRFDSTKPDAVANVMKVNPIAGLYPGYSPLPTCAEKNGISFEQLLTGILESALSRTDRSNFN